MNLGLHDSAFRKGTTPEHGYRQFKKIMGFTSKPKEESSRNAAFTKVTTSIVVGAIGLVQAKQGLPYRTHSPSPRPLLVAEHRTPCRPDAHGRGSRPQPAPPMTHAPHLATCAGRSLRCPCHHAARHTAATTPSVTASAHPHARFLMRVHACSIWPRPDLLCMEDKTSPSPPTPTGLRPATPFVND